jgi:FtsH-binding integral membrane protein
MPNSILIPVGLFWIIGLTLSLGAVFNLAAEGGGRLGPAVFLGTVGAACVVAAVGLQRRWGPAALLGYLIAALIGLVSLSNPGAAILVVPLAVGIAIALSRPASKQWTGER